MIDVEDWAEIRRLHRAERMGIKAIARRLGVARNTVREALRATEPPRYQRTPTGSLVDAAEPAIRELLGEFPSMPTTVIAERIGWDHGMTILKERVRELRPLFQPPDPCQRTSYRPGELAQWDLWQPDIAIPVDYGQAAKQWAVVGVTGFYPVDRGWMVPSAKAATCSAATWVRCSASSGRCPAEWCGTRRPAIGRWRQGRERLHRRVPGSVPRRLRRRRASSVPPPTRSQRPRRAGQRLPRDELPTRPALRRCRRLQPAAGDVAASGRTSGCTGRRRRGRRRRSTRTAAR